MISAKPVMETKRADNATKHLGVEFDVKFASGAPEGTFAGYASIFGNEDLGGDVVLKGAFRDTLKDWKAKGKLPKMLLQHGHSFDQHSLLPIGVWSAMSEDSKGLYVEGRLFALDTERGKTVYAGLKEGALDGLSIGYRARDFEYGTKPEEPYRTIKKLDLFEVSIVLFGMNEEATIDAVKADQRPRTIREFETALREKLGYSHGQAKAIAEHGFKSSDPRDEDDAINDLLKTLKSVNAGIS